jgi:hypothetical protein
VGSGTFLNFIQFAKMNVVPYFAKEPLNKVVIPRVKAALQPLQCRNARPAAAPHLAFADRPAQYRFNRASGETIREQTEMI